MRQGTELEVRAAAGAAAGPVSVAGTGRALAGWKGWLCWGCLKTGTGPGQVLDNFLPFRALLREEAGQCPAPVLGQGGHYSPW